MRFIKVGQDDVGPNERPPFGCCLLIFAGTELDAVPLEAAG
jgi:hypothetical protein